MNKQQITQEEFDKKVKNEVEVALYFNPTRNKKWLKEFLEKFLGDRFEIKNQEANNEE